MEGALRRGRSKLHQTKTAARKRKGSGPQAEAHGLHVETCEDKILPVKLRIQGEECLAQMTWIPNRGHTFQFSSGSGHSPPASAGITGSPDSHLRPRERAVLTRPMR